MTLQRRYVDPAAFNELRLKEVAQERCGLCWELWPVSVMVDDQGRRRCPNCVGATLETVIADDNLRVADHVRDRQTKPQITRAAFRETIPWVRVMEDVGGNAVWAGAPLTLTRGGASKTLALRGGGFASTDTFSYSTGITATTALTGTATWTLTLTAGVGATPGTGNLIYNNHTYRGIFSVR